MVRKLKIFGIIFFFIWCFAILTPFNTARSAPNQPARRLRDRGPSLDPHGKTLEFGILTPGRIGYTIDHIKISHQSTRPATVHLKIEALRNEETNYPLNPSDWCKLSLSEGTTSKQTPLDFSLRIRLPKKIPSGLPDGRYVGTLKISSPDAIVPLSVPIVFTIDLPDFSPVPSTLSTDGMIVNMFCCLPDERNVSFGLTTDAAQNQDVRVIAPLFFINDDTEESISSERIWITIPPEGAQEADRNIRKGKKPTSISFQVHVSDDQLHTGSYSGELAVRAKLGRTLYIPIHVHIPSSFYVERIRQIALIGGGVTFLLILFFPIRRYIGGRNRFRGTNFMVRRAGNSVRVPRPWNRIINVQYTQHDNCWNIGPGTGFEFEVNNRRQQNLTFTPQSAGVFRISGAEESYLLRKIASPGSSLFLSFRVLQSPYSRGRIFSSFIILTMLLGVLLYSFIHPDFWCNLF